MNKARCRQHAKSNRGSVRDREEGGDVRQKQKQKKIPKDDESCDHGNHDDGRMLSFL